MTDKLKPSASGSFAKLMQTAKSEPSGNGPQREATADENSTNSTSERATARPVVQAEHPNGRAEQAADRTRGLIDQIPDTPKERKPERYSFQFWDDQIVRLKRLRQVKNIIRDPYERKEITMSDMVRQAIDDFLDKQTKQIKQSERPVV